MMSLRSRLQRLSGNKKFTILIPLVIGSGYFFCTFFGLFFSTSRFFYLFIVFPLVAIFLLFKKPSLLTLALGLLLTNFSIQLTGSTASFLFFFYYILIFLIGLLFLKQDFILAAAFIVITEASSNYFHHQISNLLLLLPVIIFAALVGFFLYRERNIRNNLETKLAGFLAKQGLVRPGENNRPIISQPLTAVAPTVDIETSLRSVVQTVKELFNPNSVAVFLNRGENFVLVEGWSSDPSFRPQAEIHPGQGFISWVGKERKPLLVSDFVQDARTLGYYSQPIPLRSFVAVPILLHENLLGVIAIDSKTDNRFESDARDGLLALARIVAVLVDTLRAYETVHREALRFSALSELSSSLLKEIQTDAVLASALSVVTTLFKPDQLGYAQIDRTTGTGTVQAYQGAGTIKPGLTFNLDDGLVGWVARHNKYLINHNLGEKTTCRLAPNEPKTTGRSFLGTPTVKDERCIGVLWLEKNGLPIFTEQDATIMKLVGSLLSVALIRAQLYEQIADLAIRDSLTGLFNHRKFQELLDEELTRSKELVLLLLDVDHFKELNDRFGHPAGDTVLEKLAKVLASLPGSIAARYGGEEFAIIIPNSNLQHGVEHAETVRQTINRLSFRLQETEVRVTASIGVAHFPSAGQKKWQLISSADRALYQAKAEGRNRVVALPKVFTNEH